jgi:ATP-binding cassette subfamily B (MDR/TAP) protein 1
MYIGWAAASLTGLGLPSFVFLIGDVINSFDAVNTTPESMLDKIKILAIAFSCVGLFIYIVSYIYFALLLMSSERIIKKTRTAYVEAILKQESAWFDVNNPSELNARIGKECITMQKALGEKMGTILLAFAMTLAGLTFAFIKGWSFSLAVLGSFPFIAFATAMMNKVLQ